MTFVGPRVLLQATNGKYLNRYTDGVFANATNTSLPSALWYVRKNTLGQMTFEADNGQFLSRCQGNCGTVSLAVAQTLTLYASNSTFNVTYVTISNITNPMIFSSNDYVIINGAYVPKAGTVRIKADNGMFLRICKTCSQPDLVSIENGDTF